MKKFKEFLCLFIPYFLLTSLQILLFVLEDGGRFYVFMKHYMLYSAFTFSASLFWHHFHPKKSYQKPRIL